MGQSILVVEDEEAVRRFLGVQLSKLGYEVLEAEDGEKALLQLGRKHFDLIISDIMMPKKDGWQLMREIKESSKTRDIPVVVLTAKTDDTDMLKAYGCGAAYYIPKPFTMAQLLYGIQLLSNTDQAGKLTGTACIFDDVETGPTH